MIPLGLGVTQGYSQALKWYRKAAEQGLDSAQYNIGVMYIHAQGVTQNFVQAEMWTRMAAEQGHAEAQYQLGLMYFRGKGVTRDYDQAREWTRKAAEQDYAGAQFNMGIMFFKGKGVSQDYTQAHMWFSLAAANGYEKSHKSLDTVAKKMTPAEISKAQRLASEWLPSLRNDHLNLATKPAFTLRGSDLGTVILLPTKDVKDTPTGR